MKSIRGNKKMNFHNDRKFYEINSQREKLRFDSIGEENIEKINSYDYAVIYFLDRVSIVDLRVSPLSLPLDKIMAIRAFNDEGEYFVNKNEGKFSGRVIVDFEEYNANIEKFEIVDEYHKLWGKASIEYRELLAKEDGTNLKPADELSTGKKTVFVKVRNYFNTKDDLMNVDFRLCGFELLSESGKEGEA